MDITFRTDASIQIGTGHVMRCLTLADALKEQGAHCHFVCREHPGNLIELIKSRGHTVTTLPLTTAADSALEAVSPHAHWLGATQREDAQQTIFAMCGHSDVSYCFRESRAFQTDWLIVDHYALDVCWEREVKPYCRKLMVIDDLADRPHLCDLLLDQTFSRQESDYAARVSASCKVLCGAEYALLRPEFLEWRPYSLQRRHNPQLKNILVAMGGVDKDNITGRILDTLNQSALPVGCQLTVVMGTTAPWRDKVHRQANAMAYPTTVLSGIGGMARLMADSDLAIGAAGATSWERCCLGLPTIMFVLAKNQHFVSQALEQAGAARAIHTDKFDDELVGIMDAIDPDELTYMSESAMLITDGNGVDRVVSAMDILGQG